MHGDVSFDIAVVKASVSLLSVFLFDARKDYNPPPPLFVLGTSYILSLRAKTKNKQYILSRLLVYYVKTFTSNL